MNRQSRACADPTREYLDALVAVDECEEALSCFAEECRDWEPTDEEMEKPCKECGFSENVFALSKDGICQTCAEGDEHPAFEPLANEYWFGVWQAGA